MPRNDLKFGYAPVVDGVVQMPVKATLVEAWTVHTNPELEPVPVKRFGHSHYPSGMPAPNGVRWHPVPQGGEFKPMDREPLRFKVKPIDNIEAFLERSMKQCEVERIKKECLGEDYNTHCLD